jgi:hypothetical protein
MMSSRLADAPIKEILQRSNYTIQRETVISFEDPRQLLSHVATT